MPTPQEIKDAAVAQLDAYWASIETQQEDFKTAQGRYWQGLATHSALPADGADVAPDRVAVKPSDEALDWSGAELPPTMKACLTLDNYESTAGHGFVAILDLAIDGEHWQYKRSHGPINFDRDWVKLGA